MAERGPIYLAKESAMEYVSSVATEVEGIDRKASKEGKEQALALLLQEERGEGSIIRVSKVQRA